MKKNKLILGLAGAAAMLVATASIAQPPGYGPPGGGHPAYLRALADLREARWLIQGRSGEGVANGDEHFAMDEINKAIVEIRQAAIDDGKDTNYSPPPDAHPDRAGRLHDALEVLHRARVDLTAEEDNGWAQGLRNRSIKHVEAAAGATENAIRVLHERGR